MKSITKDEFQTLLGDIRGLLHRNIREELLSELQAYINREVQRQVDSEFDRQLPMRVRYCHSCGEKQPVGSRL